MISNNINIIIKTEKCSVCYKNAIFITKENIKLVVCKYYMSNKKCYLIYKEEVIYTTKLIYVYYKNVIFTTKNLISPQKTLHYHYILEKTIFTKIYIYIFFTRKKL